MTTALGVVQDGPENPNDAAARRLREKFAGRRISASAVAREIGMTQAAISRRMLGKTEFTLNEIAAICHATGISYEFVVLGRETKNPGPSGPGSVTLLPHLDSNQKPAGLQLNRSDLHVLRDDRRLVAVPIGRWQRRAARPAVIRITRAAAA